MSESNDLRSATLNGPTESEEAALLLQKGRKSRRISIIIGVIGLFLVGIAAGIAAFVFAGRAEAAGVKATAGKVLGVLDIIGGIVVIALYASNM
jgi:flagellar basal body-associated protein FliL